MNCITLYQHTLSPDHGPLRHLHPEGYCPRHPTCSEYSKEVIAERGVLLGIPLAMWHMMNCHPWRTPDPERIHVLYAQSKHQEPRAGTNVFAEYFYGNSENSIHKWEHYFEIYDRHLAQFIDTDVHVVEIGIAHGGSLNMWKRCFGAQASIYGVDINKECAKFEEEQIQVFIGDQENEEFLRELARCIPRIDVLIDDGGHSMQQQIRTLEILFPHLSENGVYLCEDTHTSYWKNYGGGLGNPESFIEHSKEYIDGLHAWHTPLATKEMRSFCSTAHSLHYYDSVLVIEKRPRRKPREQKIGKAVLQKKQKSTSCCTS